MIEDNSRTLRGHRRLWSSVVVLLVTVFILLSPALTSCGIATPTPTTAPPSPREPAPALEEDRLPPFVLDLSLPSDIVLNAGQGLGQCHWLDPDIIANPLVSWAYDTGQASAGWDSIEPEPGVFHWEALDAEIAKARSLGKRIWIEVHTTEGRTPQWARDAGVELVGSRGGTPVPWNETYHRLLRRVVHAMAARYDGNPTVDAVNVMAGGCYGEMAICAKNFDLDAWEDAGYTDEKYIEAAKQFINIYLEEEHTWEDGTTTHGFLETPVVVQLGAGLYERTLPVIQPVVQHAMSNYGMRVWLKYNGLGGGYEMRWVYQDTDTLTRGGYEPMGNSPDFLDRPKYYVRMALDHHSSYLCLQSPYFDIDDPEWREAREMAARYLGAQIVHLGIDAPDTVLLGHQYTLTTQWVNRGTVPLMRPERQGIKDVPASYDIQIAFVDSATGVSVFEHTFTPAVPTTQWYSAQPVVIEQLVPIPVTVPVGTYDLRLALVNPNLPAEYGHRYFRFVNTDLHDGSGRYTVGQITVGTATAPTATPTPSSGQTPSGPNLPPVIFVMLDWFNGDWGNPDYHFSYIDKWGYRQEYRGHPEYGALGGWAAFHWNDLNPEKGFYDWSKTDKYIRDAQAMQVTLPDGSVIAKPVGIAIETWAMEELDNQIGINYTPYWVAAQGGGSTGSCYDPDGSGPCKPFCTPRFSSLVWQYWLDQFILAMGQHYDNNPEFYNLAFVLIATGADQETSERKSFGDCAYNPGGNTRAFDDWVFHVMGTHNIAFPNTPHFIQSTLHGIHYHAQHAATFPSKMTGVKVNGLEVDVPSAEIRFDGVLVGGVTGFSEVWHESIPTGFEPKHGNGIKGSYWFYMQGLSVYPYMFDIQLPNIKDAYLSAQQIGFPIQDFVRTHLGKSVHNTPDVWIVLRKSYFQDSSWTGSDGIVRTYGPHHEDFEFYLYRRDSAPGSRTVPLRAELISRELPDPARGHIYAWQSTRRTNQGTGNPYMSFDVDDRYPHVGQVPEAAGGQVSWHITVTLVNEGTDTFSLEYTDYYGNVVERQVTKGTALGTVNQWVDYTWNVNDAYFNNGLPGGMDFRIDCNNDGNEIIHRLIVRAEGPPPPTPTVTLTRPPTRTPTRTTTPATPTPTGTRTPTSAPSPTRTNTRPPSPTVTTGPSPTPTITPTLFPPGPNTITLQQHLQGYRGTNDTSVRAGEPAQNFGNQANIQVKNDSIYSGLLRFDLGSMPPGSTINQATLALYTYNRDKIQAFELQAYRVLRPWIDSQATWERASIGNPWAAPGINDTTTDRAAEPAAGQTVSLLNTWYELDITELVRDWSTDPQNNHGVVLRGSGDISVVYHFASANHATKSLRPILVIDYTAPEAPVTATPTAPATETPPPSGTPEASATPTEGVSQTSTNTPRPSPTPTASLTPTITPTPFPGGPNTVTLQQDLQGYRGTKDTTVLAWAPAQNFGNQASIQVKNDSVYSGLLRFDLGSIPLGSTINQATLALYTYNRDKTQGFDLEAYRVLRPWVDLQATWERASIGNPWAAPGINDTTTDRAAEPATRQTVSLLNTWYELDITELVRDWSTDPQSNHGVVLRGSGDISVVYHFASANHTTKSLRPMLVIDYTAPEVPATATPTALATETPTPSDTPEASATPTEVVSPTSTNTPWPSPTPTSTNTPRPSPTPTASLTPTITPTPFPGGHNVVTLQQGVAGYQGTNDTYMAAWNPSGNFVHQANIVVKNDTAYSGLLRFDLGSMPLGSTINQAILRLYAYNRDKARTFDLEVYRLLRLWVDTEANWDQAFLGNPWGVPGANDTVTDRQADPVAVQAIPTLNVWYEFDITELVRDWTANPQTNDGVLLRGFGQLSLVYHFASSNHPIISLRPQLVIDYTAPEVPTPTPGTPTATATTTRTPSATPAVSPTATPSPTPEASPTVTATAPGTPTVSPTPVPTLSPTPTALLTPTPGFEDHVEDMERRVGILAQLIRAIIDILKRAGRIGR